MVHRVLQAAQGLSLLSQQCIAPGEQIIALGEQTIVLPQICILLQSCCQVCLQLVVASGARAEGFQQSLFLHDQVLT